MAEQEIFVYGSLTEGFVHYDKVKEFVEYSKIAFVSGEAHQLQCGYPVVTESLASDTSLVKGQLLKLKAPSLVFSLLDHFHGVNYDDASKGLHFKKTVGAKLEDGSTVQALCYFINPLRLPKTAKKIPNGVWSVGQDELLPQKLTDRQKAYILELGKAKGRDIVPINNLSLYRELINLELIVDKGRRLALSKLGHEVFRYLN